MDKNRGVDALIQALEIIKERGKTYGAMRPNMTRIAGLWTVLLGVTVTPAQVAMCMIAVKLARLVETPDHVDSVVDIAGYAAITRECQNDE